MAVREGKRWWLFFVPPALALVVLLPAAIWIGLSNDGGRDTGEDTDNPQLADNVDSPEGTANVQGAGAGIVLDEYSFQPDRFEARVGETVRFVNQGDSTHGVKVGGDVIAETLERGREVTWTPDKAGEFEVLCTIHPNQMSSTIVVSGR